MTDWDTLAKFDSDLALRFAIQAELDPNTIPEGHTVGFKAVHADLRSGHDRAFRWPVVGLVEAPDADQIEADGQDCGPGLHLARTAQSASASNVPLHTILLCSYSPDDVIHDNGNKVRLRRCTALGIADAWGANLAGADLAGANLAGANLYGANLTRANLTRANLYGAYLTGADLTGANLYGANLTGANLYGADLTGADLAGASFARANLMWANADHRTCWPDGFDPVKAGVTVR